MRRLRGDVTTLISPPKRGTRAARHTRVDSLDGIRAIAVVLVLAFHVNVPGFHGGFLGVDIFFVLSGYLITTLLMRELINKGSLDLGRFWLRRSLRLLPAALLVILVVLLVSALAAPAFRRADIGADAFWSLLYVANWRFITSSGYFSDDGTVSPLQHMWSLAVEEQFYLIWPLLLAVLLLPRVRTATNKGEGPGADSSSRTECIARRRTCVRRGVLAVSVMVAAASAVAMVLVYDPASPDRAYMGTDTRAFSPLMGAITAALMQYRPVQLFVTRQSQKLIALALCGVALGVAFLGTETMPTPTYFLGGALLFAALTAVLVAATSTADRREGFTLVLGSTPFGYIGKISYGMYLWHWPLTVWIIGDAGWDPLRAAVVVASTVASADLSYRLVEVRIRHGHLSSALPRTVLSGSAAVVMAATLVASTLGGTPWNRFVPALAGPAAARAVADDGAAHTPVDSVVVVGDSVIQRLLPALDHAASEEGVTVLSGARGGCPALPIVATDAAGTPLADGNCAGQVAQRQADALASARPDVILWWSRYEVADRLAPDGSVLQAGTPEFWRAQREAFAASVDTLTAGGATLVVVETDRPGVGLNTRCTAESCAAFIQRLRDRDDLRQTWNKLVRQHAESDPRVRVIPIDDVYCRDDGVPCDDRLPVRPTRDAPFPSPTQALARPDGSHFGPEATPTVAKALLERAIDAR